MQFLCKPDAHHDLHSHERLFSFDFGFTIKLAQRKTFCAKCFFDALDQRHHILPDGAGEKVNGLIAVFGPGMQTCMRLCEKQKTGKAVRAELVKALIHNRQAAITHSLRKQRVGFLAIHENLMVAVGEIKDKMLSKFQSRVHSHLQGLHGAARATDLFIDFQQEGSCRKTSDQ